MPQRKQYNSEINWQSYDEMNIDNEIAAIQQEMNLIATDRIPWSKQDILWTALAGILGASFEVLSTLGNSSKNPIGNLGSKIHNSSKLKHDNEVIDYREKTDGVSFGGVNHRLYEGHDIAHYKDLLQQYQDREFRGGGYKGGMSDSSTFYNVTSKVNKNGIAWNRMTEAEAKKALNRHLFADFFSPKGLPLPFSSDLLKYLNQDNVNEISNYISKILKTLHFPPKVINQFTNIQAHDLRKIVAEMYSKKGVNLRSELEKGLAFSFPELICRMYVRIVYKKWFNESAREYSKEAIDFHLTKMLLIAHSIVGLTSLGMFCITESPSHINIPSLIRVFQLACKCTKENIDFNTRIIEKANLQGVITKLYGLKTFVICSKGWYETNVLLNGCEEVLYSIENNLNNQQYFTCMLASALDHMEKQNNVEVDFEEMSKLVSQIPVKVESTDTLESLIKL